MLRDEANHAQALAAVFGRFLGRDVLEKDGGLCEGANPFAVAFRTLSPDHDEKQKEVKNDHGHLWYVSEVPDGPADLEAV